MSEVSVLQTDIMKNKVNRKARRNRKKSLFKRKGLHQMNAHVTEEQDWYLDSPDVRLTRVFLVVILLHVVAVGGIFAFRVFNKASENSAPLFASQPVEAKIQKSEVQRMAASVPPLSERARAALTAPAVQPQPAAPASVTSETPEQEALRRAPAPLRPAQSTEGQYLVQAGDTVSSIAAHLRVDGNALRQTNSIRSDNELYPGRWLTIPTGPAVRAKASAVAKPIARVQQRSVASTPASSVASPSVYTVVSGDTAWGIARKLQVSYKELMDVNGIDRPESLQIGQQLRIPQP